MSTGKRKPSSAKLSKPNAGKSHATHETPTISRLPFEVKALIVSKLLRKDAKQLSLVSREWRSAAESYLWANIRICSKYSDSPDEEDSKLSIAAWKKLWDILKRRSDLAKMIHEIRITLPPCTGKDILAVLRSIAPTLTSLQQQDFCDNHDEFEICDYVKVAHRIYAKHSFPRLESAELHFDVDWLKSLPGVLQAMPQLRHLTLHGRATEEMELKKPTRLPSLEKVSTLSLKPSGCYLQLLQALLPKCTSIRGFNLALDQFAGDAVDDHEVSETLNLEVMAAPLLKLQQLKISCWALRPQCVVRHRSYRELRLDLTPHDAFFPPAWEEEPSGAAPEPRKFGSRPSRTVSGRLSSGLVIQLDGAPRLQSIWVESAAKYPTTRHVEALHIQSFKKGNRELYHGRMEIENTKFLLDCHAGAYATYGRWHWKDTAPDKFDPTISRWAIGADDDLDGPSLQSSNFQLDLRDPDTDDTLTAVTCDLTNYRGYNLPYVLLDYVYSQIDRSREWTDGQRGLPLPDHVWEVLDDWVEEIEKLRIQDVIRRGRYGNSDDDDEENDDEEGSEDYENYPDILNNDLYWSDELGDLDSDDYDGYIPYVHQDEWT